MSLLVTRPNVELVGSVDGLFRFAWFRKLNISALNCTACEPLIVTFLNSAMSHWYWPGPYMLLRGALPNVPFAGFGPEYKVPGLPHRTGHGIGLDGHEWTNFVRGNKTPIQPGMCFSDEPTIAIYGEFGVRLEDCLHITPDGPKFFSKPSVAIDQPFA